ncbi:MAG: hypothetical protein K0V04_32495, partial [Deltaproteobacteria bacterium]|nr:hypothetical protein [Deltaproteobacteria bacterium]
GGNVMARMTAATFEPQMARLRAQIERHVLRRHVDADADAQHVRAEIDDSAVLRKLALGDGEVSRYAALRDVYRARHRIRLLVQPAVDGPDAPTELPYGVGFSYDIRSPDDITPTAWAGQLYTDPDRKEHLGALLSPRFAQFPGCAPLDGQLRALCRVVAARGYRGPISFDGMLDADGDYRLIYDCNPRMTAVLPALVVQRYLRAQGAAVSSLANLDYRGRYTLDDPGDVMERLDSEGLLCRRGHPRGVLLLPNIARTRGWDALCVDMELPEILAVLDRGLLGPAHDAGKGSLTTPYL